MYQTGDLILVSDWVEPAIVVTASRWHCINIGSLVGSPPPGCDPYYQILKILQRGKQHCNVHSHNVRLLASTPPEP